MRVSRNLLPKKLSSFSRQRFNKICDPFSKIYKDYLCPLNTILKEMTIPKFSNASQSFHGELKKRISDYFKNAGKSSTGNFSLYFKAIILVTSFSVRIYSSCIFYSNCMAGYNGMCSTRRFNGSHWF